MVDKKSKNVIISSIVNSVEEFYKTNLSNFETEKELILPDIHKIFENESKDEVNHNENEYMNTVLEYNIRKELDEGIMRY